ncbi:MAG: LTA synthase family protein [Agathobacter sp.]|uniref:LTA synthase family protein n=1 Tax=Agathobacter sp. TaxID=2021311 RepID=UPI00257B5E9A|nr:LTA synthase family protein [Agathobacter sp.]MBQ1680654.1 LTA synthase family protein [Agathobacter sp.]
MPKTKKERIQLAVNILIATVVPAMLFYLMEFYEHNPFVEVRAEAQFFNVLIFELIGWGLFFICKKAMISLRILSICAMLFGLINHYVMKFRSTPFVPWDIFSIKTAKSVAGNYDFTPDVRTVIVTVLFLAIIAGLQFFHFQIELKIYYRLIPFAACFLLTILFAKLLQDDEFQTKHYLYPFLFTPAYMTKVNGMTVTFMMNLEYVHVEKPAGYHADEAQEILEEYDDDDSTVTEEYPNIIVIMNEAFSDVGILSDFQTNEDYMPFMHSVMAGEVENTIHGYLNVSVCGGNTANTEFEFLTGNTMRFLPTGSIPYQQYVKNEMPSLARFLKTLGYETYGMHPYYASGWDRDTVYPLLGLDHTVFYEDWFYRSYLRSYISDACDFDMIRQVYEKNSDSPLFLFNVTMQNHGSYSDAYENFHPNVTVSGSSQFELSQYLSLIQVTDRELADLIEYFKEQKEKTVVVFFGDHQPNDYTVRPIWSASGDEEIRYQVPYMIWANYDIPEKECDTSANYLAAQMLENLGMPRSKYQNFLLELAKQYPIISSVRMEQTDDAQQEMLDTYQKLQYYSMFDYKAD